MGVCGGCLPGPYTHLVPGRAALSRHLQFRRHLSSQIEAERIYGLCAVGSLCAADAVAAGFVELAVELLEDRSWNVRHAAAAFLVATAGAPARCTTTLERLLKGTDSSVRLLAASVLQVSLSDVTEQANQSDVSHLLEQVAALRTRKAALVAVQVAGESLKYVGEDLQRDRQVVSAAVYQCGQALRHAAVELRQDRAIVLVAVAQDGLALQHVAQGLRYDAEVLAKALGQNEAALCYAPEAVRDASFMQEVLGECGYLSEHWLATEAMVFGSMFFGHSAFYLSRRGKLLTLMRDLASAVNVADSWMHAMVLLDAVYGMSNGGNFGFDRLAVAAVMLAGKMTSGSLNYIDQGPMVALHFGGGSKLSNDDLQSLRSAETHIVRVLQGRLLVPSVSSWADMFFRRMTMFAGNGSVAFQEALPIAMKAAEILACHVPASNKTPPRMLAATACATSLVGVGLLPMEQLLWSSKAGLSPMEELLWSSKAGAQSLSKPTSLPLPSYCKKVEGVRWPKHGFGAASPLHLDITIIAKAVGLDVKTFRAEIRATLCAYNEFVSRGASAQLPGDNTCGQC